MSLPTSTILAYAVGLLPIALYSMSVWLASRRTAGTARSASEPQQAAGASVHTRARAARRPAPTAPGDTTPDSDPERRQR